MQSLPILPHCNALDVAPDGLHAIVWYDHGRAKSNDPTGSFQAVTVLNLAAKQGTSFDVSIGFRPRSVHFANGGKEALVVTDDGVSILDFATLKSGAILAAVPLSDDPLDSQLGSGKGREVQITRDGKWAVVRQAGFKGVRAIHLASKQVATAMFGSEPTDVDVLPDGSAAIVVLRATGEIARVNLPTAATKTLVTKIQAVTGFVAVLARITSDGKTALLYTTVSGHENVAAMDTSTLAITPVVIRKTVHAVLLPEGSRKALLVYRPADGPNHSDPTEAFVDDAWGYTYYDLDTGFTKLVLTDVRPTGFASVASPARIYMLLPDPKGVSHAVHRADLGTFLGADISLGSRPEFVRFLPAANVIAVAQKHPTGRMTFIDVAAGKAKTVTGYELNSRVK